MASPDNRSPPAAQLSAPGDAVTTATGDLARLDVDKSALARELAAAGAPVSPADLSLELLPGGRSNITVLIRARRDRWVLRCPPLDAGHRTQGSSSLLERELRVLRALERTDVPAPVVLTSWADERVIGSPAYVMTFSEGTVLEERLREEIEQPVPRLDTNAVIASVINVLAAIHAVPVSDVGLSGWRRPGNFLLRRLERWTAVWASAVPARPQAVELARTLNASVPSRSATTLIHGDYRAGNLVLGPDDSAITAVLDWEMSTVGDPLTDLGFLIAYSESIDGHVAHKGQELLGRLSAGAPLRLAQRYADVTGRAVDGIPWYVAEEHWKTAAVLQLIAERNRRGATVGSGFDGLDDSIDAHLYSAAAILKG